MKITLNLATRPYADQGPAVKRLRIGMAVLAVMLVGLGFGLRHFHQSALAMAAQEDAVNQTIAKVRQEQLGYQAQMQQPANARVLKQAEFLNGLFDEKAFSWTAAMEDLERILPAGVQVTALEPSRGKDGRITLHLRVSGQRERSVELVRNLEKSRRFLSPRISSENAENNAQGSLQPAQESGKVTFDILAEYNPATLEERRAEIAAEKRAHPGMTARSGGEAGAARNTGMLKAVSPVAAPRMPYVGPTGHAGQTLPQTPNLRPMPRPVQGIGPGSLPQNRPPNGVPGSGGPQ